MSELSKIKAEAHALLREMEEPGIVEPGCKRASLMSRLSAHAGWEGNGVAMARYLTSEWYLLTGVPTAKVGFDATQEGYSFTPAYDNDGRFFLREGRVLRACRVGGT